MAHMGRHQPRFPPREKVEEVRIFLFCAHLHLFPPPREKVEKTKVKVSEVAAKKAAKAADDLEKVCDPLVRDFPEFKRRSDLPVISP